MEEMPQFEREAEVACEDRQRRLVATPLTPEWARTVELPSRLRPIKRLGALAELGAGFNQRKMDGSGPLPLYMTRGDLVRTAESRRAALFIIGNSELGEQSPER